ncbi:hypothetical protein PRZ48_003536 [Zasmidium cellare]|uniref:Uncharacterized protein n=1 Tax=Zasmidium cellare TaxID=395010 RepID=A0ABR0EWW5_ZASCE|nr:hypothetical protein PRZ48_003536 [Zasmidium cellare]
MDTPPEYEYCQPDFYNPTYEAEGTWLFDQVRGRFSEGICTLENLLRFMELRSADECKEHTRGIDNLLENTLARARWLSNFVSAGFAVDTDGDHWASG